MASQGLFRLGFLADAIMFLCDVGLILFGIHCVILGYLILKSLYIPKALGILMMAGGVTYLVGSYTRLLFPNYMAAVSSIYVVALVSELALCLWLLIKGINLQRWEEKVGAVVAW